MHDDFEDAVQWRATLDYWFGHDVPEIRYMSGDDVPEIRDFSLL